MSKRETTVQQQSETLLLCIFTPYLVTVNAQSPTTSSSALHHVLLELPEVEVQLNEAEANGPSVRCEGAAVPHL